jgi:chromosome partitioning protein
MPVIAVVNRKGGSGKSTLATHLAGHYANAGVAVMLGDVDRQQSTQSWLRARSFRHLPKSAPIVGWAVDPKRVLRPPAGVTHVVLDTPGGLRGFDLARVVAFADVIVMPVCNSSFDRESAAECFAEMTALPRIASGRCKVAAVGMRLDTRTKGAEVLEAWARGIKLPFVGVLREAQAYVRCVEQGLTVFDLHDAHAQVDVAQWKPIVAWLEPVLRAVHKPVLRGNPSVSRPVLPPLKFRDDQRVAVPALVDGDVEADVAVLAADPRVASALPAAKAANGAAAAERARPAAVAAASHRLGGLFSWLTSPRFLHRNS